MKSSGFSVLFFLSLIALIMPVLGYAQPNGVNSFTGQISYSLPLHPELTLNYSSAGVPILMNEENRVEQAGWVGLGWSLGVEAIEANMGGTTDTSDDQYYFISSDGGRTAIRQDRNGVLRVESNPYWKVTLSIQKIPQANSGYDSLALVVGATITKEDGSVWKFGDYQRGVGSKQANECQLFWGNLVSEYFTGTGGSLSGQICSRWNLSQKVDPYGTVLTDYYYWQEQDSVRMSGTWQKYTRACYLDKIVNQRTGQKVVLTRDTLTSSEYQANNANTCRLLRYQKKYLKSIAVYPTTTATTPTQSWDLTYLIRSNQTKTKRLLQSVTEKDGGNIALPAYNFSYDTTKQWILRTVRMPQGGTQTFSVTSLASRYLAQSGLTDGQILTNGWPHDSVSGSGNTIARFDGYSIDIRKWTGTWNQYGMRYRASPTDTTITNDTLRPTAAGYPFQVIASDEHVFLKYTHADWDGTWVYDQFTGQWHPRLQYRDYIDVFDWREDLQTWQCGLTLTADIDGMVWGDMSPNGSQIVYNMTSPNSNGRYGWDEKNKAWKYRGPGPANIPASFASTTDNAVLYDNGQDLIGMQWIPCQLQGGFTSATTVIDSSITFSDQQFVMQERYLGRWDKSAQALYAYTFDYDTTSQLRLYQRHDLGSFGGNMIAMFSAEHIVLYDVANFTLYSWRLADTGFIANTTQSITVNYGPGWQTTAKLNDDWLCVLNFDNSLGRGGSVYLSSWNSATSSYDSRGSFAYTPSIIGGYDSSIVDGSIELDRSILAVSLMKRLVNFNTFDDSLQFTDAFKLDAGAPSGWSGTRCRIFANTDSAALPLVLTGYDFVATHSKEYDWTRAKMFHDVAQSFSDTVLPYVVTNVTQADSLGGSAVISSCTYSTAKFGASFSVPMFDSVNTAVNTAGSVTETFKTDYSQPALMGMRKDLRMYDATPTLVGLSSSFWSLRTDSVKWYIYTPRLDSVIKVKDGLSTPECYVYNDTNGMVSKITERVGVQSDLNGTRDRVTSIQYALTPSFIGANQLNSRLQTIVSAAGANPSLVEISKDTVLFDANGRQLALRRWNGTSWITTDTVTARDQYGNITESRDVDGIRTTTLYGFNSTLPIATIKNGTTGSYNPAFLDDAEYGPKWSYGATASAVVSYHDTSTDYAYSGRYSFKLGKTSGSGTGFAYIYMPNALSTMAGKKIVINAMIRGANLSVTNGGDSVCFYNSSGQFIGGAAKWTLGGTFDWTFFEHLVTAPANTASFKVFFAIGQQSAGATIWLDNIRIQPSDAYVTTMTYDSKTLQRTSVSDENNNIQLSYYDGFGRSTQTFNSDRNVISEQSYYRSRTGNGGNFSTAKPNFNTTVNYTSPTGYDHFLSNSGWSYNSAATFNVGYAGETTVRIGFIPGQCPIIGGNGASLGDAGTLQLSESSTTTVSPNSGGTGCDPDTMGFITKTAPAGDIVARVDFYPNIYATTPIVLAYYATSPRVDQFAVLYYGSTGQFKVRTKINNGSYTFPYTFTISAPLNAWYTVEIEKSTDGSCRAWVYLKGRSRNYVDMYTSTSLPANWTPSVWSWSDANYLYLANLYVGAFSQTTTFSDGLDRVRQTQVRDGVNDFVSAADYDAAGRDYLKFLTYRYNTGHAYDGSYSSHAQSVLGITPAYSQITYKDDPFARSSRTYPAGYTNANNERALLNYGTATLTLGKATYSESSILQSNLAGAPWTNTRSYVDALGRPIQSETYASGVAGGDTLRSKSRFNFLNKPVKTWAPKGDSTLFTYDYSGRLTKQTTPDNGTSKFVYDNANRLRFMIDSAGLTASPNKVLYWKYDAIGRVIEKGYITSQSWGDGSVLQNYAKTDPTWPSTPSTWRKKYGYDNNTTTSANYIGRLYSVLTNNDDDNTAEVEEYLTYDRFGNDTTISQKIIDFNDTTQYITTYRYDQLGRNTEIVYPSSAKGTVDVLYNFDMPGRISQIVPKTGSAFAQYAFTSAGLLDSEKVNLGGTSRVRRFSYDSHYWLTSIWSEVFNEKIGYSSGGYNTNEGFYHGLIAADTSTFTYTGAPAQQGYKLQYDGFGRLLVADNNVNSMDVGTLAASSTTYDLNGNITRSQRGTNSAKTYTYYSATNRLKTTTTGSELTYDSSGRAVTSTTKNLIGIRYDPFTELTMVIKKSSTDSTRFEYGGGKQRVYKVRDSSGTSRSTLYIHGLDDYPLMEKTSSGTERMYVYGPTGLVAFRQDSIWFYVLQDHLGSIRIVLNTSGTVQASYDYDAYGKLARSTVTTGCQYQYTGQEFDIESGVYNYRARNYDQDLGIFYATDPAGSTNSPYGYVRGNPVVFVDPTGMQAVPNYVEMPNWEKAQLAALENSFMGLYNAIDLDCSDIGLDLNDGYGGLSEYVNSWNVNGTPFVGDANSGTGSGVTVRAGYVLVARYRIVQGGESDGKGGWTYSKISYGSVFQWAVFVVPNKGQSYVPAYATVNVSGDVFGISAGGSLTLDKNGHLYVSPAKSFGPTNKTLSASIVFGFPIGNPPTESQLSSFLSGQGNNISVGSIIGYGLQYNNKGGAVEFGVYSPQLNFTSSYSFEIKKPR